MDFGELRNRARQLRSRYAELERQRYGQPWSTEQLALGFVGDVGDLAKLVQAQTGQRTIDGWQDQLGHELADCLWSLLVLADRVDVDLETEFLRCMDQLEQRIAREIDGSDSSEVSRTRG